MGSLHKDGGLVFAMEKGHDREPYEPQDTVLRAAPGAREAAGHPVDLRYTCATLLLTKNVNPKVVSEMLGHANIAITLDTYSHVLPNMQDSAARALEEALR